MDIARTFSETLIGYISNVRSATNTFENPNHSSCNCSSGNRTPVCDSSTSTHDLSTFVWNTEGAGIDMLADVDEDKCYYYWDSPSPNGRNYSKRRMVSPAESPNPKASRQEKQKCRPHCDASTSSFDLNAFIWCARGCVTGEDDRLVHNDRDGRGFDSDRPMLSIELSQQFIAIGQTGTDLVPVDNIPRSPSRVAGRKRDHTNCNGIAPHKKRIQRLNQ